MDIKKIQSHAQKDGKALRQEKLLSRKRVKAVWQDIGVQVVQGESICARKEPTQLLDQQLARLAHWDGSALVAKEHQRCAITDGLHHTMEWTTVSQRNLVTTYRITVILPL